MVLCIWFFFSKYTDFFLTKAVNHWISAGNRLRFQTTHKLLLRTLEVLNEHEVVPVAIDMAPQRMLSIDMEFSWSDDNL